MDQFKMSLSFLNSLCKGEVVASWLESQTRNWKVVSSILRPAGIVGGGVNVQRSLHLKYHDWGALEQDTEPPTAPPRPPQHELPTAVCVCVCVCVCARALRIG